MKRSPLRRRAPKYPTAAQLQERREDCHGIPFDEYRLWLPERCSDWLPVKRVKDPSICGDMHGRFLWCFACGVWQGFGDIEAHHITGGTKGRSDEYCNIAMLCRACHANANTAGLPMGRILYLKWKHDRQHTDWVRLALLHRKHLPDLITT